MGWHEPATQTPEQIKASADAHRENVILTYQATLTEIEKKITAAKRVLDQINKDIDGVHAKRLAEYDKREEIVSNQEKEIKKQLEVLAAEEASLKQRNDEMNSLVLKQDKRLTDLNTSLMAQSDQLESMKIELDENAAKQVAVMNHQQETQIEHEKRKVELDQATTDMNDAMARLSQQHDEIKVAIENHQKDVEAHKQAVAAFTIDQQKNFDYHNALIAKENDLQPFKQKYEEGIAANEKEAKRLKDKEIDSYAISREAQKRLSEAIEAEVKAKNAIDKLAALKTDIHAQIKQEG